MFYEWKGAQSIDRALRVKRDLERTYLVPGMEPVARAAGPPGLENIVGMGIGEKMAAGLPTGEMAIKVYVVEKLPRQRVRRQALVPAEVGGFKTDVEEVGEIKALRNTGCMRPAPGGISCGHLRVTAGTLGCLVKIKDKTHILGNNHVLAESNGARTGDLILQPGAFDGGVHDPQSHPGKTCRDADHCLGRLSAYVSIDFTGKPNRIDAAVALPIADKLVSPDIVTIGRVAGSVRAKRRMFVKKSGRTTQLTHGIVSDTNASFWIDYDRRRAFFADQIVVRSIGPKPFSDSGDSGSLVLDERNRAVGLLFAGSAAVTIVNKIQNVLAAFKAKIVTANIK